MTPCNNRIKCGWAPVLSLQTERSALLFPHASIESDERKHNGSQSKNLCSGDRVAGSSRQCHPCASTYWCEHMVIILGERVCCCRDSDCAPRVALPASHR